MATQKITCEQAKQIDLVSYLETLSIRPAKHNGNDYWYHSPFHQERTPSFKINRKLNVWYDHSIGKGGNLVDFGIAYHHCSVAALLEKLNTVQNLCALFSFHRQYESPDENNPGTENERTPMDMNSNEQFKTETDYHQEREHTKMKVLSVTDISNERIKAYIASRGISLLNAQHYCKEILVAINQRQRCMIGFKNQSGGYELRATDDFKSTIAPKDFTFLPNEKQADLNAIAVVEGFFDFLSLLEKQDTILPEMTNFLVLNSLSFFEKAVPVMEEHRKAYLLLDNDNAGKSFTASALKRSIKYTDLSHKYSSNKDLNEWLVKEKNHERLVQVQRPNREERHEAKQVCRRGSGH